MICENGYQLGQDYDQHKECSPNFCGDIDHQKCKQIHNSCSNKADFGSEAIAKREARLKSSDRQTYTYYHCKHCSGWHIGQDWRF